jgi:diguanylate cyclase (GGDEF)-like protein/putative nucleotidyltransferase with HDIG domain
VSETENGVIDEDGADHWMVNPASNIPIDGRIRLLSDTTEQPPPTIVASGDLLHLARLLSLADSQADVWHIAESFLSECIGSCTLDTANLVKSGDRRSREMVDDVVVGDLPLVESTPEGCRAVLTLGYPRAIHGRLIASFHTRIDISQEELDLIEFVAFTSAGDCARLENTHNFEDHLNDLSFIHRLEQQISVAPDVPSIGSMLQVELGTVIENTLFALLVSTEDRDALEVVAYKRADNYSNLGFVVPVEGSKAGRVFRSGEPLLVDNVLEDDGAYGRDDANWRSLMIAPLLSGTEIFGVVMVGHEEPALYSERDLRIVELAANHIANAIYRLLNDEREQNQYRAAIESLSAAVDARDPFTHMHSLRVSELAHRLALKLGFTEDEAEQIELAGLLHDIGKIGVPDRVLAKPGPLDPEERLIMMSHAELGANIVGRSPLLAGLIPMVRHHHEWFDGRGYPDGLGGADIPLSAAILGVADALETMTSNRVYRSALSVDRAIQELTNGSGSQFHPDVVAAMLALLDSDMGVHQLVRDAPQSTRQSSALLPMNISDVAGLQVMQRVASEIGSLTEIDSFLDRVHTIVRDELDLAEIIIWLLDDDTQNFVLSAGASDLPPPVALEQSRVRVQGTQIHPPDAVILGRDPSTELSDKTVIFPMYVEDRLIGLIELVLVKPGEVAGRHIDLLHAIAAPVASTVRVAQLHDIAKRAAMTDGLTGVLNHRAFYEQLDQIVSEQDGTDALHLLIVDVIGLKAINDNFGHISGDSALKAVADAVVQRLRPQDIVARYGGDEFAAILKGSLWTPLEEIIESIEAPVPCDIGGGVILDVRLRCGSSHSVNSDTRATELVARADARLYDRVRPSARVVGASSLPREW